MNITIEADWVIDRKAEFCLGYWVLARLASREWNDSVRHRSAKPTCDSLAVIVVVGFELCKIFHASSEVCDLPNIIGSKIGHQ